MRSECIVMVTLSAI